MARGWRAVALVADQSEHPGELLPMIEAAWRPCLEIGERPDLSHTVVGAGSCLAARHLALVLGVTGRVEEARAVWRAHPMLAS